MDNPKFIDVDGVNTRYFESGTGDTLVLVHGGDFDYRYFPSATSYYELFERLSTQYHVVAFDRLGCGYTGSPKSEAEYTMRASVDHAAAFMRALSLNNVSLFGHSRGSLLSLRAAIDYPDLISRLVIENSNSACPESPFVRRDFYTQVYSKPNDLGTVDTLRRVMELLAYRKDLPRIQAAIARRCEEFASPPADRPMTDECFQRIWNLRKEVFMPEVTELKYETLDLIRRGRLRIPTLIIWSMNDQTCPLKMGTDLFEQMSMRLADVEMHLVNHAGHMVYAEQPDIVSAVTADFLSRHDAAAAG